MYFIHLVIIISGLIFIILALPEKMPTEIKQEGIILQPFFKIAQLILRVINPKQRKAVYIKKKLRIMNPFAENNHLYRVYSIKQLGNAIALLYFGNILAFAICLSSLSEKSISDGLLINRNDYGGGERSVVVDIYADDELIMDAEEIRVSERQYTQEEIEIKFGEIGEYLEKAIIGKNKSLDYVTQDLVFPDSVPGYPVSIEWELSDYSVIGRSGEIYEDNTKEEGTVIDITAIMTYFQVQGEHVFHAAIYPREKDQKEIFLDNVRNEIMNFERQSVFAENSVLPSRVDDVVLSYEEITNKDSVALLIIIAMSCVFVYGLGEQNINKQLKKREEQLLMDYPQIVDKITLLLGAGMTIRSAIEKLGNDYTARKRNSERRYSYEELLLCVRELESGISEGEAYVKFGNRCGLLPYIKFGALLSQNLKRGTSGLLEILENEERDAFENRKALARKLGEEAGTKLLLPMALMLIVVLVIVIIPAFLTF